MVTTELTPEVLDSVSGKTEGQRMEIRKEI